MVDIASRVNQSVVSYARTRRALRHFGAGRARIGTDRWSVLVDVSVLLCVSRLSNAYQTTDRGVGAIRQCSPVATRAVVTFKRETCSETCSRPSCENGVFQCIWRHAKTRVVAVLNGKLRRRLVLATDRWLVKTVRSFYRPS